MSKLFQNPKLVSSKDPMKEIKKFISMNMLFGFSLKLDLKMYFFIGYNFRKMTTEISLFL